MDFLPAKDVAWRNRNIDWNLRGQLLIGIARKPDLRRSELGAQVSLLEIDGFYCFGEKEIDGHSRIGLSENLGEMLLHGFGRRKRGITEFQLGNLECGAFDADLLHVAFTSRIRDDRMLHRALRAARCE